MASAPSHGAVQVAPTRQNLRQEWRFHSACANLDAGSDENRCNLLSATRRSSPAKLPRLRTNVWPDVGQFARNRQKMASRALAFSKSAEPAWEVTR